MTRHRTTTTTTTGPDIGERTGPIAAHTREVQALLHRVDLLQLAVHQPRDIRGRLLTAEEIGMLRAAVPHATGHIQD